MKFRLLGLLLASLAGASGIPARSYTAIEGTRGRVSRGTRHPVAPVPRPESWQRLLKPPLTKSRQLPIEWKVAKEPRDFRRLQGGLAVGTYQPPITVDEMTRDASIIVVGTAAGHDGGFYPSVRKTAQHTTYYLRVAGYLKDTTGRRAPFLKVLAPGGFLDGGEQSEAPVPYLERGPNYLLYLIPNRGVIWGLYGKSDDFVGTGDEYWALGRGVGRWWEDGGRLVGPVSAYLHHELPVAARAPTYLPFGEGIKRVAAAVDRERRGTPYQPPKREEPTFVDPNE